jgi:hypothetical protein
MQPLRLLLSLIIVLTPAIVAADSVFEDWNDGDDGGWLPATTRTAIEVTADGGVDDTGFLRSWEIDGGFDIVGAVQLSEPYVGDYGARGYRYVSVALKFISDNITVVRFRVRYLDGSHNGWYVSLTDDFTPGVWQICGVEFDPLWSDAEAIAAGWVQEVNSASFQETMANVYSAGVRAFGAGELELGIDNFSLDDTVSDVPQPAAESRWSHVKALYSP